jgi:DNA polymerase (family X)
MATDRQLAKVLEELAVLYELAGDAERARRYQAAVASPARRDDPEVADVVQDVTLTGGSVRLDALREATPEGFFELLRLPTLGPARIRRLHEGLGIETVADLEAAARAGTLATLPRFGAKLTERILRSIAQYRRAGAPLLLPHAQAEAQRLLEAVGARPGVTRVAVAGEVRRHLELVRELVVVAACDGDPVAAAAALTHAPEVEEAIGAGTASLQLRFSDGVRARVLCVRPPEFGVALWRATGAPAHVAAVERHAAARGWTLGPTQLRDAAGAVVPTPDEADLYRHLGLPLTPPERREDEALDGGPAGLLTAADLQGVLHCHSHFSDGSGSVADLAAAARARGWRYVGVTDHSQSALNAGGLSVDAVRRQHDEIDAVNAAQPDVRILKGVEADILPCGRVDYPEAVLDSFDFVIASVHTRMGMNAAQMTARVCKALEDPHVTILGHPTGRLLLTREGYPIDLEAVFAVAGPAGVAIELNADPHRLDLDWRTLASARAHGVRIAIGPDAHTPEALDHTALGVGMARKGGLTAADVLNAGSADDVLAFAARRRGGARMSVPPEGTAPGRP